MTSKKIPISKSETVLIICEGYEEEDYIKQLRSCKVWTNYKIRILNAQSLDKIAKAYKNAQGDNGYLAIAILCDTEDSPYEHFIGLKEKLRRVYGEKTCDNILFFTNPGIMQLILLHFGDLKTASLNTNNKFINRDIVKKLTGVPDYEAKENHRRDILKKITPENYTKMLKRAEKLSNDYRVTPSSNVPVLFTALEGSDSTWFKSF